MIYSTPTVVKSVRKKLILLICKLKQSLNHPFLRRLNTLLVMNNFLKLNQDPSRSHLIKDSISFAFFFWWVNELSEFPFFHVNLKTSRMARKINLCCVELPQNRKKNSNVILAEISNSYTNNRNSNRNE